MNESIKSDVIIDKHAEPIDELNGFGILIPFVKELGFVLDFYDNGKSQITYSPKPEHLNSFQVAHGGAVMTLMDVSMATAARSVDKSLGIVTIEMKTSFLRPSTGQLIAKGELMHRTRTTAFVESKVLNALICKISPMISGCDGIIKGLIVLSSLLVSTFSSSSSSATGPWPPSRRPSRSSMRTGTEWRPPASSTRCSPASST